MSHHENKPANATVSTPFRPSNFSSNGIRVVKDDAERVPVAGA
jgi:hypothetical protein